MKLITDILKNAAVHPRRIALSWGEETLTYEELVKTARDASRFLRLHLGEGDAPVGVYGGAQTILPALFLGCLLAGRPYLPLEDTLPRLRLTEVLRDSGAPLVLSPLPPPEKAPGTPFGEDLPCPWAVVEPGGDIPGLSVTFQDRLPSHPPSGEDGAGALPGYLLYTSGSTGHPKGVRITGENLDYFLGATRGLPQESPGEAVWLTHAPLSFDLSVLPLWQGLARGDRVVRLDTSRGVDFPLLARQMSQSGATCWVSTPSFARLWIRDPGFCQELLPELTVFFFCGEVLEPSLVLELQRRFPRAKVLNAYGPTETTVACALVEISRETAALGRPLPVGRPLPGTFLRILGEGGRPQPPGETGEIVIGGPGVGKGYLGLGELTSRRFYWEGGILWYRTGDYGYLLNSTLYFQGRRDLQCKFRGCRIELEDVEQNLLGLPGVTGAAAALRGERLTALISLRPDAPQSPRELLGMLRRRLPPYLLPQRILVSDSIPLTPQGKTDREAVRRILDSRLGEPPGPPHQSP